MLKKHRLIQAIADSLITKPKSKTKKEKNNQRPIQNHK
jgi:hypothetical protein